MTETISNIDTFIIGEKNPTAATWAGVSIIVKVTTSSGAVGWGEAVPTLRVGPVVEAIKEAARVYIGRDPHNVEANLREWYKHDFYMARSFESTTAASAIDIASWDIIGRELGAPLHELLGGRSRDRVRAYANGWYDDAVTPADFAEKARKVVSMGYTGLKFDPFGKYFDWIDQRGLEEARARVKAVRDVVGDGVDIMIEHHGRFNPNSAISIAETMSNFNPLFMEEPVHPEDLDGLAKYRSATRVKVALGERLISLKDALTYLEAGLLDFIQPDITNIGGVTGARKVVALAEAYGVEVAFHNAFGPIQNAVTIQLDAAIPNFLIQESFYDFWPQWKRDLVNNETPVINGHYEVPSRPGIGVTVNEKLLENLKASGPEYFNPEEPVWVVKGTWK